MFARIFLMTEVSLFVFLIFKLNKNRSRDFLDLARLSLEKTKKRELYFIVRSDSDVFMDT